MICVSIESGLLYTMCDMKVGWGEWKDCWLGGHIGVKFGIWKGVQWVGSVK